MALQSSGQISFFDVVLEHRPNNTTVGSGLKPFRLDNYNSYSTNSVDSPLTLKEFYGTSSSYNTSRYDNSYTNTGNVLSWAASVGDIKEIYLYTNSFLTEPGSESTVAISLTNGGTYKLRYFVNSNSSNAYFVIGHGPSNFIYPTTISNKNGFFGPFNPVVNGTNYNLGFSASSTYDSLAYLYARIIRIA